MSDKDNSLSKAQHKRLHKNDLTIAPAQNILPTQQPAIDRDISVVHLHT